MKDISYFQDILYGLERILYYERGKGSIFRTSLIGTEFIKPKKIEGDTPEEIVDKCIKELIEGEIVKEATYSRAKDDILFTFKIKGCIHLPVEARLKQKGVPPYVCAPMNMVLYKVAEALHVAVESVDINVDENNGECVVRAVVFEAD